MSYDYDRYLKNHKANVKKGYEWFKEHLPEVLTGSYDYEWQIGMAHDESKTNEDEYDSYDAYFYGGNQSYTVVQNFNKAWLLHIHRNPHHWQYWILINDNPEEGENLITIPDNYILEMICDWWSFSWQKGNLEEIFGWYEERKDYIKMNTRTKAKVESILYLMSQKLIGSRITDVRLEGEQ